jgi:hypothetical protein
VARLWQLKSCRYGKIILAKMADVVNIFEVSAQRYPKEQGFRKEEPQE